MTPDQIVRAWKDADYGAALPLEEASMVPAHPVGGIEIPDDALGLAAGGMVAGTEYLESLGCCKGFTQSGYCDVTGGPPGHCTWFCFTFFWTSDSFC
jgi:mersacidin/lichenicidin family type 2 lantibiotic